MPEGGSSWWSPEGHGRKCVGVCLRGPTVSRETWRGDAAWCQSSNFSAPCRPHAGVSTVTLRAERDPQRPYSAADRRRAPSSVTVNRKIVGSLRRCAGVGAVPETAHADPEDFAHADPLSVTTEDLEACSLAQKVGASAAVWSLSICPPRSIQGSAEGRGPVATTGVCRTSWIRRTSAIRRHGRVRPALMASSKGERGSGHVLVVVGMMSHSSRGRTQQVVEGAASTGSASATR